MSPAAMLLAAACIYAVGALGDRAERWYRARRAANHDDSAGRGAGQSACREPAPPALTPAEQALIALLAGRYARADTGAGRHLADYLRTRCPGIGDVDLMRCVIALGHVARYFGRRELTATDALAAYLHAIAGAALELTAIERDEIPR